MGHNAYDHSAMEAVLMIIGKHLFGTTVCCSYILGISINSTSDSLVLGQEIYFTSLITYLMFL